MLCGKSPLGGQRKSRGILPSVPREALWVEVGEREEPSHSARKKGSTPGDRGGSGKLRQNATCAFFPP